jgi:hypothetical protein
MSLNMGNLGAYTDETGMDLIKAAVLKGRTADIVRVQGGIKSSASINIIGSSLSAQAGACGWNVAGTTNLSQRDITVCDIKINEAICLNTLEEYYTQVMMNPGSYNENIPFEQIFAEEKRDQVMALVDDIFWKGSTVASRVFGNVTVSATTNYTLCDGLLEVIYHTSASATTVAPVLSGTAFSAGSAIAIVDSLIEAVPQDVMDSEDLVLFLSYGDFRTYATALRNANLFHYSGDENQGDKFSLMVPGTNVRVYAVRGLANTKSKILTPASNIYMGTDLLSDAENFKIWYSQDNDECRFLAKWKQGSQLAFPQFVVFHKL